MLLFRDERCLVGVYVSALLAAIAAQMTQILM